MLRVSARRHAAGSLTFFSHGPSYGPPEIWSKDAKFGSTILSPFPSIRDQATDRRQTERGAKPRRAGHGNPVRLVVRHEEQTKQDEKVQEASVESIRNHQHAQRHTIVSEKAQCSKDERSVRNEIIAQTNAITKPPRTNKRIDVSQPGLFIEFTFGRHTTM